MIKKIKVQAESTYRDKALINNSNMSWVLSHSVFIVMVLILIYDYTAWKSVLTYAGYFALGFFIITLALNPLIKIKSYLFLIKLNRYRRQLGVASFSYAVLHAGCFFIKRSIDGKWQYLLHPAILPVLILALPILFILAVTSNQYSIKKFSFPKWKKIHKAVYFAEIAIILHLLLAGHVLLAFLTFLPLISIQFLRRYNKNTVKS